MTDNATTNECSDYDSGHERVHLRFCAFAMKVAIVALLVLIASLPVARTVVGFNDTRSFGPLATRSSGECQFATYNVPHLPPDGPLSRQEKRERKRAPLKATCRANQGRALR